MIGGMSKQARCHDEPVILNRIRKFLGCDGQSYDPPDYALLGAEDSLQITHAQKDGCLISFWAAYI